MVPENRVVCNTCRGPSSFRRIAGLWFLMIHIVFKVRNACRGSTIRALFTGSSVIIACHAL